MTVVILHNPRSGSGKAQSRADAAAAALAAAGIPTARNTIGSGTPLTAEDLKGARCLVVVGGDGTVLRAAPTAIEAACPLYHLPTGNENLFARAFNMTDRPADLLAALESNNIADASVGALTSDAPVPRPAVFGASGPPSPARGGGGRAQQRSEGVREDSPPTTHSPPHPFLLVASIGPDAGVIRRLAATRTRATGHAAYLRPVIAETLRPLIPRITLEADGKQLLDAQPGWLLVANARQYALRLDPVPDADILAPRLDLVFIPTTTSLGAALALLRARRKPKSWLRAAATHLQVTADSAIPPCCQLDGELGPAATDRLTLELTIAPTPLKVLRPA